MQSAVRGLLALIIASYFATQAFAQNADLVESPPATEAVLVLAIDPPITSGGFGLRRIDLVAPAFGEGGVMFDYAGLWASESQRALRARDRTSVSFVVRTVPIGTYVATFEYFNDSNVVSHILTTRCTSEQAAVIEVIPGQVNVVRSNEIYPPGILGRLGSDVPDSFVLSELAAVAVEHPHLADIPVLLHPAATVSWRPERSNTRREDCENGSQLRVLRRIARPN